MDFKWCHHMYAGGYNVPHRQLMLSKTSCGRKTVLSVESLAKQIPRQAPVKHHRLLPRLLISLHNLAIKPHC